MSLNCIYIEDNLDNHFLFEMYIKGLDINMTYVETTDSAMNMLEDHHFDLILLDLNLPGSKTPWEVIDYILADDRYSASHIWLISAMQDAEVIPKIGGRERVRFMRKPIRKKAFVKEIEEFKAQK